jgi:creatinine amidohydrolase
MPPLDLVARRTVLETDAECCLIAWWSLLTLDKAFLPRWRQSHFPGGCAHACELETSMYLHLSGDDVRTELVRDDTYAINEEQSDFAWVDLFAAGPATPAGWTSSFNGTGVFGEATLATAEKGMEACDEAVRQLVRFVHWWQKRPPDPRRDLHRTSPTIPMPWGQSAQGIDRPPRTR